MVTHKFNDMIEAFECDFNLALEGDHALSELEKQIKVGDRKLLHDISLLRELSFLLRHGMAEIHLLKDSLDEHDEKKGK